MHFLGIDYAESDASEAISFAGDAGLTFPHLQDPDSTIQGAWQISGVPVTFIVRDGTIVTRHSGQWRSQRELDSAIDKVIKRTHESLKCLIASLGRDDPDFFGGTTTWRRTILGGAGLISEEGNDIVLTRRPLSLRHHAGQVALPGGRAENTDETIVDTALREAHEEVGLDRRLVTVRGVLPTATWLLAALMSRPSSPPGVGQGQLGSWIPPRWPWCSVSDWLTWQIRRLVPPHVTPRDIAVRPSSYPTYSCGDSLPMFSTLCSIAADGPGRGIGSAWWRFRKDI
ncbi:hypothetical protein JCM18918_3184 [Cutibacterium acnes JCM 18918]|nr:hypothetical protein JCM18918_3184 [Cutibacterium acnes JCM 18918]